MNDQDWNQRYLDGRADWPPDPSQRLAEAVRHLTPGSALDLACGTGRNALHLARRGWSVTAIDFAEEALKIARERAHREELAIDWRREDLLAWTPPEAVYDLVLICYLHIPWDSYRQVLTKAEQALRSGGHLVILGHDLNNITEGTGKPKYTEVAYTADDIAGALTRCKVVQAYRDHRVPDHNAADRPGIFQIDCVVKAVALQL